MCVCVHYFSLSATTDVLAQYGTAYTAYQHSKQIKTSIPEISPQRSSSRCDGRPSLHLQVCFSENSAAPNHHLPPSFSSLPALHHHHPRPPPLAAGGSRRRLRPSSRGFEPVSLASACGRMRAAEPNRLDAGLLYVGVGPAGTARRARPGGGETSSCLSRAGWDLTLFVCVCVRLLGTLANPPRGALPSLISIRVTY